MPKLEVCSVIRQNVPSAPTSWLLRCRPKWSGAVKATVSSNRKGAQRDVFVMFAVAYESAVPHDDMPRESNGINCRCAVIGDQANTQ